MTSGTAIGDKERAKKILYNTLLGFVIILVSWLIVYTIIHTFTDEKEGDLMLRFLK